MATEHHSGSCQCGAVAFDVTIDLSSTLTCNCSRCRRLGTILAFAPWEEFTLKQGDDATTSYKFNKHVIDHKFCSTCGVQSYSRGVGRDGKPVAAINVRCLDGVDLDALKPKHWDGASM